MNNLINQIFNEVSDRCDAIYKGGSSVDPVLNSSHDEDFILFAKHCEYQNLQQDLMRLGLRKPFEYIEVIDNISVEGKDFSQIRSSVNNRIDWFSYLDVLMIKVIGEDVCPKTDIIKEYRKQFLKDLREKALWLQEGKIKNQKRWYHILRGVYILINNSYGVSEEQKREINILHDVAEGWEEIRDKTIQLLKTLD